MSKSRDVSQFSNFVVVDNNNGNIGIATTATPFVGIGTTNPSHKLHVVGDARITGILTVGNSSIIINGDTNIINVGTGITINGNLGIISATSIYTSASVGSGDTGVRKITTSTSDPTGGSDGDIWIKYTA